MILPPDKSFNYHIPELKEAYVRTGVIGDGSCFFHAYLRAFRTLYRSMAPNTRKEAVAKLRAEIANSVTLERLREIGGGTFRRLLFFRALRQVFETHQWDIPLATLIDLLETTTTFADNFYATFVQSLLKESCVVALAPSQQQALLDALKQAFWKANQMSLDTFQQQLNTAEVGSTEIEYIARYLECNFLFLYETEDGIQRYPFSIVVNPRWPYCVLLWVQECHYEVIGRKEPNSVIQRIFYSDDELVQKLMPSPVAAPTAEEDE